MVSIVAIKMYIMKYCFLKNQLLGNTANFCIAQLLRTVEESVVNEVQEMVFLHTQRLLETPSFCKAWCARQYSKHEGPSVSCSNRKGIAKGCSYYCFLLFLVVTGYLPDRVNIHPMVVLPVIPVCLYIKQTSTFSFLICNPKGNLGFHSRLWSHFWIIYQSLPCIHIKLAFG